MNGDVPLVSLNSRAESISSTLVLHGATLDPNQKMSKTAGPRGQRGEAAGAVAYGKIMRDLAHAEGTCV